MKKAELIAAIRAAAQISSAEADTLFDELWAQLTLALAREGRASLPGLGTFVSAAASGAPTAPPAQRRVYTSAGTQHRFIPPGKSPARGDRGDTLLSLTKRILTAMALGILSGLVLNAVDNGAANSWIQVFLVQGVFDAVGSIFIASLKLLVVPLVFVSLVCGTATLGNHARMGSLAIKTIALYLLTTAIAISIAIAVASLVAPGEGVEPETVAVAMDPQAPSIKDTLVSIFPDNPVKAMAEGNMLQVIVFSVLLGIAIARSGDSARPMVEFFENLNQVIMKMVLMLVDFAPYGVFCLLAKLFAGEGIGVIRNLIWYFGTVICVLAIQCFIIYPGLLRLLAGLNPRHFFQKLFPVLLFGFSSASSNATLPLTLTTVRDKLGVDNKVSSFTLPLGATVNMDGTSIMQGVATVFIAQAYAIDVGLGGYLMVVLTATLASIGTAGVPGVGMITLTMVLQQAGLPVEGIAMIIGVDRLLDMLRTSVNISGDAMVSLVVADSESLLDREKFAAD